MSEWVLGGGVGGLCTALHLVQLWRRAPQDARLELLMEEAPVRQWNQDPSLLPVQGSAPDGNPFLRAGDTEALSGLRRLSFHTLLLWDPRDPPPGGPGIGRFSLLNPNDPSGAQTLGGRALVQLHQQGPTAWILGVVQELVSVGVGADVLPYLDLFFTHELDVELRLGLIGLLTALRNPALPEGKVLGQSMHTLPFSEWLEQYIAGDAVLMRQRLESARPHWEWAASMLELAEGNLDAAAPGHPILRALLADEHEEATLLLGRELERVLREIPPAVARIEAGDCPLWTDPLAYFGPDFALLGTQSAYDALSLLADVFVDPPAAVLYRAKMDLQEQLRQQLGQRVAEDPRILIRSVPAQPTRKIGLRIWTSQALVPSAWAQEALIGPGLGVLAGPLRLVLDRSAELFHDNPFGTGAFPGTVLDAIGQLDISFPPGGGWPERVDSALKAAIEGEKWEEASRLLLWGLLKQLGNMRSLGPQAVRLLGWLAEMADPEKDARELSKFLRYRLVDLPEGEALGASRRARSAFLTLKSVGWPE